MDNIFPIVAKIIAEQIDVKVEKVKPESHIFDDLYLDSLDTVELLMSLEEAFDLFIPDDDNYKLTTVSEICLYIKANGRKLPMFEGIKGIGTYTSEFGNEVYISKIDGHIAYGVIAGYNEIHEWNLDGTIRQPDGDWTPNKSTLISTKKIYKYI